MSNKLIAERIVIQDAKRTEQIIKRKFSPLTDIKFETDSDELRLNNCHMNEAKVWNVEFAPILLSYIELDMTLRNEIVQDISATQFSKISIRISRFRECRVIRVRKRHRPTPYTPSGILKSFVSILTEQINESGQFSTITTVGFRCQLIEERTYSLIESQSSSLAMDFTKFDYIFGLCDIRVYHPTPNKCGKPEVLINSNVMYSSQPFNSSKTLKQHWLTKISYECNTGFTLSDISPAYRKYGGSVCGLEGYYIAPLPTCKPDTMCELREKLNTNLVSKYTGHTYWRRELVAIDKTEVIYQCKYNYQMNDHQTCTLSGWSGSMPNCTIPPHVSASMISPKLITWFISLVLSMSVFLCCLCSLSVYFTLYKKKSSHRPLDRQLSNTSSNESRYEMHGAFNSLKFSSGHGGDGIKLDGMTRNDIYESVPRPQDDDMYAKVLPRKDRLPHPPQDQLIDNCVYSSTFELNDKL